MTQQLSLSYAATVGQRFDEFHAANPNVYDTLVRLAREWIDTTGRRKLAIATLFERARWEIALATNDPDYKINNNYKPYYARLIMARNQTLDGLFDLRASDADEWLAERLARAS
jgi:hypothetical protein